MEYSNSLQLRILFILLFVLATPSRSIATQAPIAEDSKSRFTPANWTRGFHFLPSVGFNSAVFSSSVQDARLGGGLSLRTDIGYYLNNDVAIELGASVKFNRVSDFLVWDNLFTIGVRMRISALANSEDSATYARFLIGRGPAVVVFHDRPPAPFDELNAQRLHLEGPVGGLGLGLFRKNPSGTTWFLELLLTVHAFDKLEVIKSDGDVPIIVAKDTDIETSQLTVLHFVIGALAF